MTGVRPGAADDAALIRALIEGSETALADLYDRHADALFALAHRMTSDRSIAEEIVQESFLALWNHAETYDPGTGSLGAWLHAIARNRVIDRFRAAGRRPTLVPFASPGAGTDDADALDRSVAGGTVVAGAVPMPAPEEAADRGAFRDAVRTELAAMPEDERTVILLAYQEELTQTEIAARLAWPLGTVKTRTRRALARLREALGPDFAPGPVPGSMDTPVGAGDER